MAYTFIKTTIILLAILNFGFMAFDGGRALIKGDYIRPKNGAHAGQLGPWNKLVSKVGIHPESTTMKSIFLVLGLVGLITTISYAFNSSWGWKGLLIVNILSLWNMVAGTASSVLQIIFLVVLKFLK